MDYKTKSCNDESGEVGIERILKNNPIPTIHSPTKLAAYKIIEKTNPH